MYQSACQMILSALPRPDGFDPELGLKLHDGNVEDYYAALSSFVESMPQRRREIVRCRRMEQPEPVQTLHELRRAADLVGAHIIARLAEVLECSIAGSGSDIERPMLFAVLLDRCDEFDAAVGEYLRAFAPAEMQTATGPQLLGYFKKLRQCANEYDLTGAEEIVLALEAFSFPNVELSALFEQIRQSVDGVNYDFFGDLAETCCSLCGDGQENLSFQNI